MRTTFTPAPDIADRLYELAKNSKKSLNEIVNDLIRKGLDGNMSVKEPRKEYDVRSKALGRFPGIDYENLTKVAQDLEDEDWLKQHGRS